jgi:hypothetical protein
MTDPQVGQAIGIVITDGNEAGAVDHEIVDALVPLERHLGNDVSVRSEPLGPAERDRVAQRACKGQGCQSSATIATCT